MTEKGDRVSHIIDQYDQTVTRRYCCTREDTGMAGDIRQASLVGRVGLVQKAVWMTSDRSHLESFLDDGQTFIEWIATLIRQQQHNNKPII